MCSAALDIEIWESFLPPMPLSSVAAERAQKLIALRVRFTRTDKFKPVLIILNGQEIILQENIITYLIFKFVPDVFKSNTLSRITTFAATHN
jgi:hypothetical protein